MKTATRKTITLRDVAALAGIDKATASRALNGKGYISPQTRDAAFKAARELGFEPDLHAQRLANGRSHNIIGLLPASDLGVSTQQASFIEHRLDELGYEVEIHAIPRWVSHFEERQVSLVNKVRRQRPGAILFESVLASPALHELRLFVEEGGIVVSYGSAVDLDCDQVIFDSEHRAYIATRHLLDSGHCHIGFAFHGPVTVESSDFAGFARALAEFGVPMREDWLFGGGNYEEGGAKLAEAFVSWEQKPTGLCIINDVSASTFVTMLARQGRRVPQDVSVVGFDDVLAARYALVPLTSVTYPLEAIGRQIVDFVHSRFQGYDGPPRQIVVQSEMAVRESVAPPIFQSRSSRESRLPSSSKQRISSGKSHSLPAKPIVLN